jgi:hypothetical protein
MGQTKIKNKTKKVAGPNHCLLSNLIMLFTSEKCLTMSTKAEEKQEKQIDLRHG